MTATNVGVRALIQTTAGNITLEFMPEIAPNHVANFLKLAEDGFYNGTRFHRTIPGFMIQGGCPNTKDLEKAHMWGTGGPGHSVDQEFNATPHVRGIVSAARSQDENSAGSQFFLCHGDAGFLDNQYTVYGKMVDGDEALDAIANAPCNPGGEGSTPVNPVEIVTITIERPE
jgi:peptidyl-prolyl cis-trans isomerase B (cyclophilin B)